MTPRGIRFGFALGGLVGGLLAGLIDGLGAMDGPQPGLVLTGSVGLHALFGGLVGIGAGLVFPVLPPALTPSRLLRRLGSGLRPAPDVGLHDRCRAVATVWLLLGVGAPLLALSTMGNRLVLSRVQSPELAAIAAAGLALLLLAAAAAVFAPLHAGLARVLEFGVRRRPQLTPAVHPAGHLVVAVGVGGLVASSALRGAGPTIAALDLRPLVSVCAIIGPTLVLGEALAGRLSAAPPRRALLALGCLGLCAVGAAAAGLRVPEARDQLAAHTGSGRLLVALARAPFDRDGDGFARALGGGDCNDDDAAVNPAAVDVPANGIDEDCSGTDAPARNAPSVGRPLD